MAGTPKIFKPGEDIFSFKKQYLPLTALLLQGIPEMCRSKMLISRPITRRTSVHLPSSRLKNITTYSDNAG